MRSVYRSRSLAVFLVLLLVLIAGLSGTQPFVLAQDGTPAVDQQQVEEPTAEPPVDTPVPELPTTVPAPPTETATLEPTVPVEIPATEESILPSDTATTEPSATPDEAVDPAAIGTGTLVINVFDEPGVPSTYTDMDIWLNYLPAGGSDPNEDIEFQADGPTVTKSNIPEGRYAVYVYGSQPVTGPVTIQPGQTTEVDVIFDDTVPMYIVTFGVDWLDGSGSNDAEVCFGPDGCPAYSNPQVGYGSSTSWHDIDGYSMYLPGGEYTFYFRAPGRAVTSVTRTISENTTVIGGLSIYSAGDRGALDIQVQTDSGAPIPLDYQLTVEGLGTTAYSGEALSQQINNLLPGWYNVTLSTYSYSSPPGAGYVASVSANVYVTAGMVNYTRLILQSTYRANVTFQLDAPGSSGVYWNVQINDAAGNHVVSSTASDGQPATITLPSGNYTYWVSESTYGAPADRPGTSGAFTVGASAMTVPISLPAPGATPDRVPSVTVHVVTDEGADVYGVVITDANGHTGYTNPEGIATFTNVLEGPTRFAIQNRTGADYSTVVNVAIGGANTGEIVVPHVTLSGTGTLTFEIYLSDGSPATVAEYGAVLFDLRGVGQSTVSNAGSNTIAFRDVAAGNTVYKIFAEHAFQDYQANPLAYNSWQTLAEGSVTVVAGQNTVVRVELPKTSTTALTPVPTATATTIPSATPTRTPSSTPTPTVPSGTPHTMPVTFNGCTLGVGVWYVSVQATSNEFPNSVTFNFAGGATADASLTSAVTAVSGGFQAYYFTDTNLAGTLQSVTLYLPSGATPIGANVEYAGGLCSGGAATATASSTATNTAVPTQTATATATPTSTPESTTTSTATATATGTAVTNTAPGTSVEVTLPEGSLMFDTVTQSGETTIDLLGSAPGLPSGFALDSAVFYDISTTAQFSGAVTVCLSYDAGGFSNPATVRLLHWDGSAWVDITSNGAGSNPICGVTSSLSPFAIVETASAANTATATGTATTVPSSTASSTATTVPSSTSTATASPSVTPGTPAVITTTGVNCRTGAGTRFASLGVVAKNTRLPVRGSAVGGWTPVSCFGQNGWISSAYLNVGPAATATVPAGAFLVTSTRVNCRTAPNTGSRILGVVARGASVPLRGGPQGGWFPVICFGQSGWISGSYLNQPTATATVPSGPSKVTTTRVNCRTGASTSYSVITVLGRDVRVSVRGASAGGWTPVVCGGRNGWISSQYLRP